MKKFIYADNAATTKLDIAAFEAMKPYLLDDFGNASQPYSFARPVKKALKQARETIAECIGAMPEEIYFTSGGTESDNWVIKESAFSDLQKRKTITSQIEHHAILHSCEAIEKLGYPVAYLQPDSKGVISPETLKRAITDDTRLVSVMLSNNEIGTIEPIQELASVAHSHGALFHTDAVQSIGHIPVNVHDMGVDMLSSSGHKFNGPKGIGFLYIRQGIDIPSFNDGGSQESGKRAGTENVASIVGMAAALKENINHLQENEEHLMTLERRMISGLNKSGLDYIRNGSENHVPGNISLSFKGFEGEMLLHRLDLMGICVSTGSACDSVNTRISHVLQAIGLDKSYAKGTIRVSLGKDNTTEDVDEILNALIHILKPHSK